MVSRHRQAAQTGAKAATAPSHSRATCEKERRRNTTFGYPLPDAETWTALLCLSVLKRRGEQANR
jgi:hypothetical protein